MNILKFPGCNNTRDLGGYRTENGYQIQTGRIIRSAELSRISSKGIQLLYNKWNVRRIVDFRTDGEVSRHPIPNVAPIEYTRIPVLKTAMMGITRDDVSTPEKINGLMAAGYTPQEFMGLTYQNIASDQNAAAAYRKLFDILLSSDEGATLFFCSQGRDRTGIAAMLILSALGVSKDIIEADYMVASDLEKKQLAQVKLLSFFHRISREEAIFAHDFAASDISRIKGFYRWLDMQNMTIQTYLRQVIGVSDAEIEKLRTMYLTE